MAHNLRRRQGTYWFRRRVPDALIGRIGVREIQRSLRTNVLAVAVPRAKTAWLATEEAFAAVAADTSIDHLIARVLIDRLLAEPVRGSETAAAMIASLSDSDGGSHHKHLFSDASFEIVQTLPVDQREHIEGHLEAITDRGEIVVARQALANAEFARELERLRKQLAFDNLAEADKARREAELALQVAMRLTEIGGSASARPAEVASTTETTDFEASEPVKPSAKKVKSKRAPLWSAVESNFLNEKTRSVEGHNRYGFQTERQTEITFYLFRGLVGDLPIDEYDGTHADSFRNLMLQMPSSHGKSGSREQVRARVTPPESIRRADAMQAEINGRNAKLAPGDPREPNVKRLTMKTLKRHFSTL